MSNENEVEKGFNDEELADIMSEIESLESESEEVEESADLKQESKPNNIESIQLDKEKELTPSPSSSSYLEASSDTTMNFEVSGDMKFNLGFVIDGKHLNIYLDPQAGGLIVEMDGGVKLNVPLDAKVNKAA